MLFSPLRLLPVLPRLGPSGKLSLLFPPLLGDGFSASEELAAASPSVGLRTATDSTPGVDLTNSALPDFYGDMWIIFFDDAGERGVFVL